MPNFWTMFWLGFLFLPLAVFVAYSIMGKDGGFHKSTSHYWSNKPAGYKMRDATVRDVWEHQNPRRKWESRQESQKMGCAVFLIICLLVSFFMLSNGLFGPNQASFWRQLLTQVGAPVLGGISAWVVFEIQKYLNNYELMLFKTLQIMSLVIAGVAIVAFLVLTIIQQPLLFNHHMLWIPVGTTALLPLFDRAVSKSRQNVSEKRYQKGVSAGSNLDQWVVEIFKMIGSDVVISNNLTDLEKLMAYAMLGLDSGVYNYIFRNPDFFNQTEALLLDIVKGRQLVIKDQVTYDARVHIMQALEFFYFYATDKFPQYSADPLIKKALRK